MKKGENYMVELLKDKFGNHVVQKFIDLFDHENLLYLLQIINSHVLLFFYLLAILWQLFQTRLVFWSVWLLNYSKTGRKSQTFFLP